MKSPLDRQQRYCVIGLGSTGLSVVRFLRRQAMAFAVADTRESLDVARLGVSDVEYRLGDLDAEWLAQFEVLVLSPGLSQQLPAIQAAAARGAEVIGDIELFCRCAEAPIVAVTGSNGKSTVVSMLAEADAHSPLHIRAGGNLGTPALDLLDASVDVYVLELSSFQLETTHSLCARAASVLNVSEDHMDRYDSLAHYAEAKRRIYRHAESVICLKQDELARPHNGSVSTWVCAQPQAHFLADEIGLKAGADGTWVMRGDKPLMATAAMGVSGRHNELNACFAWALGLAAGIAPESIHQALRAFKGLPHRAQTVLTQGDIHWINDSKGTNVGATLAAIEGMGRPVVLIAGGDGKGADFQPLRAAMQQHGRALITLGRDGPAVAAAIGDVVPQQACRDLPHAIDLAQALARAGDCVLFSPACASFDMFQNYQVRGEAFIQAVAQRVGA